MNLVVVCLVVLLAYTSRAHGQDLPPEDGFVTEDAFLPDLSIAVFIPGASDRDAGRFCAWFLPQDVNLDGFECRPVTLEWISIADFSGLSPEEGMYEAFQIAKDRTPYCSVTRFRIHTQGKQRIVLRAILLLTSLSGDSQKLLQLTRTYTFVDAEWVEEDVRWEWLVPETEAAD